MPVTARRCPVDRCGGVLTGDEFICRGSAGRLRTQLRAVPALLDDLDDSLARIGSQPPEGLHGALSGGCKPGCTHGPDVPSCAAGVRLDYSEAAGEAARQLRLVLHGWARVWDEETPLDDSPDPLGPTCHWLPCGHDSCFAIGIHAAAKRIRRRERDHALGTAARQAMLLAEQPLAGRVWAPELANEIGAAVRQAERAVDIPPTVTLAGTCTCGSPVYGATGDARARCRSCGVWHDARALHDAALASANPAEAHAPAAVIARAIVDPVTGRPLVTASQIRGWRYRGALEPVGVNAAGQPLYAIAAVRALAYAASVATAPIAGPLCRTAMASSCEHDSCRAMRPERRDTA